MGEEILALGIEEEYEGEGPLWFDLNEPERLANYLKNNVELNETRRFRLKVFTQDEMAELAGAD